MPYDAAAVVLVAAGIVSGTLVAWRTRTPLEGLRTLLDFLLAAGLLRLGHSGSWTALAVAAATVLIRHVAGAGLRVGRGTVGVPSSRSGASSSGPTPR